MLQIFKNFKDSAHKKIKRDLNYYLTRTRFKNELKSVKIVFENFVFKDYKDLRIHNAHHEDDVEQDQLKEKIYKVLVNGEEKSYTLEEYNNLLKKIFHFYLNFKFLIAREYFIEDHKLIRYIENRPKQITFSIYPGKIIRKDDAT